MRTFEYDVVVIGGGPAGLAAALRAREKGAHVLLIERDDMLGGILQQCIHNGFGLHYFGEELTGPEYAQRFLKRLTDTDIDVWLNTMVLEFYHDRKVLCIGREQGLCTVQAGAVVLAMGCRERTRGALNIAGTRPAGVYTAGCAQRLVNIEGYMPGKRVVVLGSGDIGMIMARRLAWEGAQVSMVCELMPYSSGLNRNIVQCLQDQDIPLYFETTVVEIHGRERVEAVTIAQVDAARRPIEATRRRVECDTLLLSVGLIPENELSRAAGVELDSVTQGAIVDERRQTNLPGVFACGNVLHVHDLVDNVSREAEIAGAAAAEYARGDMLPSAKRRVRPGKGVRYAVPQWIRTEQTESVDIYYRVDAVYKPARITLRCGDAVLGTRKARICTPGEMEKVTIPGDVLQKYAEDIMLSVEEV